MNLFIKKEKMRFKFIFLIFFLTSCGSFTEAGKALRNEKTRTTDEFLIEKRGPLSIPPNMGELPKPKSGIQSKKDNKSILEKVGEGEKTTEKSELENIFLEEIRKN
ncbi:DUF3035 domain-containing protein [Pelagibacteraceae bacterium]|nr:DUF3035 domain-containing protein [Pelagibacteraceae bacterium]